MSHDSLFARVKEKIDLAEHIQSRGSNITKTGSTRRIQPCPHCGHKDCCTLYADSYSCFSCGAGGDIINLVRHLDGHGNNLEAARALAAAYHVDETGAPKGTAKPKARTKTNPGDDPAPDPAGPPPKIPVNRAHALRAAAAEILHQHLLDSPDELVHLTNSRQHSPATIQKYKIGLYKPTYVPELIKQGYTMEDLHAVALALPYRQTYRPAIAVGMYVFPHSLAGNVVHFSLKDPAKNHKFQLKRHGADTDWIVYGQDSLAEAEFWMVEGENDRISLIERGGITHTVATIGNANTPRILDWLSANAKDKTITMCFDGDDAGKKYAARFGRAALNAGAKVRLVSLPAGKDIDDIIREARDPLGAIADLLANHTKDMDPAPAPGDTGGKGKGIKDIDPAGFEFTSFDILGELADGSIAFWSNVFRRLYRISIKDLSLDQLCQIGGSEVRNRVSRTLTENMIQFKSLKTHLIVRAAHSYLGALTSLGQGIHLLKRGELLINNGDEATIYNGEKFTRQTHPILDRQFLHWDANLRWIDTDALEQAVLNMTPRRAGQILSEILDLVSQWGFAGGMDALMVTGWFLAQVVQAAWTWRPQLWLSGSSGTGKSQLTLLLEALAGGLSCRYEGNVLTEAGLRQSLQAHTYMIMIDEFEESTHRDKIIERLRSAGHGGKGAIGSSSQEAVVYHFRHMILVASIETGLIRAAEQYRYLQIHTIKDHSRRPTIPNATECDRLQLNLVAYAVWASGPAKHLIRTMETTTGYDNRWIASIAVPLAMVSAAEHQADPAATLFDLLNRYLTDWHHRQAGGGPQGDEASLVEDILLARIKISEEHSGQFDVKTVYTERTVAQVLAHQPLTPEHNASLQAHGVRLLVDGGLFINPEVAARSLLQHTRWKNLNIRDILARADGATRDRSYIAGTQVRGIVIPEKTWRGEAEDQERQK